MGKRKPRDVRGVWILCTPRCRRSCYCFQSYQAGHRHFGRHCKVGSFVAAEGQLIKPVATPDFPRLRERLGPDALPELTARGNHDLLALPKTALFCSAPCPGNAILRTYDQAAQWRDAGSCVISGFHSPVERECLQILLRGDAPVILCPARGMLERLPAQWDIAVASGQMLILSCFALTARRVPGELMHGFDSVKWITGKPAASAGSFPRDRSTFSVERRRRGTRRRSGLASGWGRLVAISGTATGGRHPIGSSREDRARAGGAALCGCRFSPLFVTWRRGGIRGGGEIGRAHV